MPEFEDQYKKFNKYQAARKFTSVWSLFDMKSWFDRPIKGKIMLIYQGWGDRPVVSSIVESPTYATLYRLADDLIKRSEDGHHIYIEGFHKEPHKYDAENKDYQLVRLICGS